MTRIALGSVCLLIAAAVWIPSVHLLFLTAEQSRVWGEPGVSGYTRTLAARHLAFWTDPVQRQKDIGARRLVEERAAWREPLQERVRAIEERMRRSPSMSAESYPDECWTFDNTTALAAIRIADVLDGGDHRPLCRDWAVAAKTKLIDGRTGLLVSEYTRAGSPLDGPE